ncbi:hypothetical protein F5887DRAFT_1074713 [Amanita rubescens]|nr:hypothetical protein F5887DRAFT_1074713 [Amanita rubescens]
MENISTSAAVKLYQHNHYIHAPRQLGEGPLQQSVQNGLPTSTSSFDYWWPYPAWTATAATSIASQVLSSPPFPVPMTTQDGGIGMPLSAPPDVNSSTFPSSTSDASTSIPSTSSTSLTSSASSASSTSPTSTSASLSHHFNFHNFIANPRNLIPLLASVLGAILLFILFWFLCKRYSCRRYRSQNRNRDWDSYHYPSEGQGWRAVHPEKRSWWGGLFGARDEPEDVITGPKYVGIEDPDAEKDSLMDVERLGLGLDEEREVTSGFEDDIDQDPFTPSKPKRARTRRSDVRPKSSRNRSRTSSSAARSLLPPTYLHQDSFEFAVDDDGRDKEGEDDFCDEEPDKSQLRVPWESLRHKSIKRAILAKVDEEKRWTDSMRGLRAAKAVGAALSLGSRSGGASVEKRGTVTHHNGRSRSTRMARSQRRRSERQQEQGEVGRGFQIVMESPPPQLPTPGSAGDGNGKAPWSLASAFPFQLFSNESQQEEKTSRKEDPYTPVPTRMRSGSRSCGSSRAGSPVTSPTKRSQATRPPMYASSSPSVLRMRSPPSVMTPQMESALCFTPVVGSSARMGGGPGLEGINSPRGRPVKAQSAKRTEKAMELMEPEPGTIYTKTYRDRTDRAMKRVEAIVESGWNERGRVGHY